jgi:AcrR family transcriptional regulator
MNMTQTISKDDAMRKSIVDAAQKLFQQFGLAKTTMEDIAKAIGKGKSSLYYYFATKEQIFDAVVEKEKIGIEREIKSAIAKEQTTSGRLKALAMAKSKEIRKRRINYKITSESELPDRICMYNIIRQRFDEAEQQIISDILTAGLNEGEIKIKSEDDKALLLTVCAITLRGLQIELSFLNSYKGNSVNLINATIDVLVKGIS